MEGNKRTGKMEEEEIGRGRFTQIFFNLPVHVAKRNLNKK